MTAWSPAASSTDERNLGRAVCAPAYPFGVTNRDRVKDYDRYQTQLSSARRVLALAEARLEQAPLLADLRTIGVDVPTVWDLYKHPDSYPQVIPVLLKHLRQDYPSRVLEGIATSLQGRWVRPWWHEMKAIYLTDERDGVRDRLAMVLASAAAREHYEDLLTLFKDSSGGASRGLFVRPINRIGNRMSPGRGRAAIEPYPTDPVVGAEVTAVLKGRGPNE